MMAETPQPSVDAIRAMDGPALTRMAWEMGLFPPAWEVAQSQTGPYLVCWDDRHFFVERCEPHVNLAQADVVFRSLRGRGWRTVQEGTTQYGVCQVHAPPCGMLADTRWNALADTIDRTESLALLRCSVLAVTREQEGEETHARTEERAMTREEVIQALNGLSKSDPETSHAYADGLLLGFLAKEGYSDVAAAWLSVKKRVGVSSA